MNFDEFKILLSKVKNIPLPAQNSQFKMAPPFREHLLKKYKEAMLNSKKAGVLALFYPDENDVTKIILILRKTYSGVHSDQVGFPGGKLEEKDKSLKEAAIRETYEEIGVPMHRIEVIRELTEVYIPPSNFYVKPYLGITTIVPQFVKQEDEVEELIEVFLKDLLIEDNVVNKTVSTSYNKDLEVPAFNLNGYTVWGATAMMLSEIKDLLNQTF
ncbi:CoA pyrophosphatase [Yeosuana sp. MJ-SS3]|jgi:8-oxo-dGTP pyrophosphatase MutT (NUDIX family)|uniref:CoA pyrophosphatase n=1 Tax=Gilvirhabdus luticola TaxID=3079858 RepID=A0ABU3U7X4_9FLAO|nr:CoA pyrophosphatase [Yeosuana sp. MJ-SS3]MDU8886513.1 CoA pyrophosphatase [Yeosuana sp. MJ-SS3]